MIDDRKLAELMDMATSDDKQALMAMLKSMSDMDKAYFKGYVAGYSEAVIHLQSAKEKDSQGFSNREQRVECFSSEADSDVEES